MRSYSLLTDCLKESPDAFEVGYAIILRDVRQFEHGFDGLHFEFLRHERCPVRSEGGGGEGDVGPHAPVSLAAFTHLVGGCADVAEFLERLVASSAFRGGNGLAEFGFECVPKLVSLWRSWGDYRGVLILTLSVTPNPRGRTPGTFLLVSRNVPGRRIRNSGILRVLRLLKVLPVAEGDVLLSVNVVNNELSTGCLEFVS